MAEIKIKLGSGDKGDEFKNKIRLASELEMMTMSEFARNALRDAIEASFQKEEKRKSRGNFFCG